MVVYPAWREAAEAAVRKVLASWELPEAPVVIEVPPNPEMGDIAVPCFPYAKARRMGPPQIAAELADALELAAPITAVEVAGPYVNFRMDHATLAKAVLEDAESALGTPELGVRVLLEHTSANPNGPLHVGRARNPILGDTMARLHRLAGYDVHTQYYMDNLGRQVALLHWGKTHIDESELPEAARDKIDHKLVRFYQAANDRMKEDPAVAEQIKAFVAELEEADPKLLTEVRPTYEACFSGMQESLSRLGATYDSIKDESDFVQDGTVAATIEALKQLPTAAVEDDGANYLDMSEALKGNKSTKFFFTRKDQTSVYATRDVAYHSWKADWVGDGRLVNILGEDHRLQAKQVATALQGLGKKVPEVAFYAFVSLPEGKMSTRIGRVVFIDDLLDAAHDLAAEAVRERRGAELSDAEIAEIAEGVGIGAIRYNIAKIQPEKGIQFRWEEALNFEGDSAPYLQYAYARATRLVESAQALELQGVAAASPTDSEAQLLSLCARLVHEAKDAADRIAPQAFCAYTMELASAFTAYYRDHPIMDCPDASVQALRLQTVQAWRVAMAKAMQGLGIPILERM